ncbi:MAG: DUF4405 domain-containing protein [Sulfolobales archaeon]
MSKQSKLVACYVNFILLLITGVLVYISGFVLWLVLPHGQVRGSFLTSNTFLGLNRSAWENIHIVASILFLVLTIVHLILNWAWIKNTSKCLILPQRVRRDLIPINNLNNRYTL